MHIFLLTFFLCSGFFYQEHSVSEKDKSFILEEKDQEKVRTFLLEKYTQNSKTASTYYSIYQKRAEKENNVYAFCISLYYLSDIALTNGNYATSLSYANSMLSKSQENDNKALQVSALNLLGNVSYQIRKYDEALEYYIKAFKISKQINPEELHLGLATNINMIRTRIHRYQEALNSYQDILEQLEKEEYKKISNYWSHYVSVLLGEGVCYYHLQEYDTAINIYKKGQKLTQEHNLEKLEAILDMTIGEAYTSNKQYDQALNHLYRANDYFKSSDANFQSQLHTSYFHLATVFYKQKQYQKTLQYLSESFSSITNTKEEGAIEKINEMYDLAYNAAKKLDNKELMIQYGEAYRRVIDSFHLDDIRTKDRLYDKDVSDLEAKNESLLSKNQVYFFLSVLFVLIIVGLLIYHLKKQQKNKLLFEQLQQSNLQKKTSVLPKIKKEFVTDEKAESLLQKLEEFHSTNFFLAPDCNLYTTAKRIDTNTSYLSKVMNEYQQKSFNEYINQLRINHCLEELKHNKKFRSYTIKAIAEELGYKSVNTFASAFKKETGISHSYYLRQILKKKDAIEETAV